MKQRASSECNLRSINKEIPHILWGPKIHYPVIKGPPIDTLLSLLNPDLTLTSY
jgi:hypothetical protein